MARDNQIDNHADGHDDRPFYGNITTSAQRSEEGAGTSKTEYSAILQAILFQNSTSKSGQEAAWLTQGWYISLSMGIALIITLIFTSRDKPFWQVFPRGRVPFPKIILWGVIGFFLAIIGQSIGVSIEQAIGIDPGSENTMNIAKIAENAPIAIFAIVFFGPALEEFVFRRVVFGSIVQTTNFWVAAFVSAIFFALIHFDFEHIILYTFCGL